MNLVEIIKSKPVLDFEKRAAALLDKAWNRHGVEAIQSAIAKIAAKEPFLTVFTIAADKTAGEVAKALKTLNKAVWRIPPETAVQKAEGTISFNKPDLAAIDRLVKGQIAWIKDHGSDSAAAKAVSAAFGRLWAEGKTRREIVEGLRAEFADITPEKFAERFGEKKYWQLFSQHHAVLSSSISSVTRMSRTHTRYIFFARQNERTCELCGFYHNKTFEIAPAAAQYENYLKASESGDIEAMKAARPFTTDQNSQIPTTPLHIGCRCRLLADPSSNIYRKKGLDQGVGDGKLQEGAEGKQVSQTISAKIRAAKTIKELNDLCKNETKIPFCSFDGMSLKMARLQVLKIKQLTDEYATSINVLKSDRIKGFGSYTYYDNKTLRLNSNLLNNVQDYNKTRILEIESGAKSKVLSRNMPFSTIVHEFAHSMIIDTNAIAQYHSEIYLPIREIREAYIAEVDKHLKAFWKNEERLKGVRYSAQRGRRLAGAYDYVRQKMGDDFISKYGEDGYGKNEWDEFLAESFTKAKLGTPGKYDSQVLGVIDKHFKK